MATMEVTELSEVAARTGLNDKLLTGKVAVITGASRGIGAAIARELGAYGSHLVLNYARNAQLAEALAQEIQDADLPGQPGSVVAIQADVSDKDEAAAHGYGQAAVW